MSNYEGNNTAKYNVSVVTCLGNRVDIQIQYKSQSQHSIKAKYIFTHVHTLIFIHILVQTHVSKNTYKYTNAHS